MDGQRFDDLTRMLASRRSRRAVLAGAAAGLLGAFGLRPPSTAQVSQAQCGNRACKTDPGVCNDVCVCCRYGNGNTRCRPPGQCAGGTEVCPAGEIVDPVRGCVPVPPDPDCTTPDQCLPPPADPCQQATCIDGACGVAPKSCPGGQICCGGACVDLATDPAHCGACGATCTAPTTCTGGVCACVSLTCDSPGAECGTPDGCGGILTCQTCGGLGQCVAGACKASNGESCFDGTDCASNVCSSRTCCDRPCDGPCESCGNPTGECRPILGFSPACGGEGVCAGSCDGANTAACAYPGSDTACGDPTCQDGVQSVFTCDGTGGCFTALTPCGLFHCNPAATACLPACQTDDDCLGTAHCDLTGGPGVCRGDNDPGKPCASPAECLSDVCLNGICCDTACDDECHVCTESTGGQCTPVTGTVCGTTDACHEPSTCQAGTCTPGEPIECPTSLDECYDILACDPVNGCVRVDKDDGTACHSAPPCGGAGTCQSGVCTLPPGAVCCSGDFECDGDPCLTGACDPDTFHCVAAADDTPCSGQPGTCCGGACLDVTADPANCGHCGLVCLDGDTCTAGVCRYGPGAACSFDDDCQSSHCAQPEGICCDRACDGTCRSCDPAGICHDLPHDFPCLTGLPCDATGGGGTCRDGQCVPLDTDDDYFCCNGNDDICVLLIPPCYDQFTGVRNPFCSNPCVDVSCAGNHCIHTIAVGRACGSHPCQDHVCQPDASCAITPTNLGQSCAADTQCTENFVCQADGACTGTPANLGDPCDSPVVCIINAVCQADGSCGGGSVGTDTTQCDAYAYESYCDEAVGGCRSFGCENNNHCSGHGLCDMRYGTCTCHPEYSGADCLAPVAPCTQGEVPDGCTPYPPPPECENGGSYCSGRGACDQSGFCVCLPGFTGVACHEWNPALVGPPPSIGPGQPCAVDFQCTTNYCRDGVCCDGSCLGRCERCDRAGQVGICGPVENGAACKRQQFGIDETCCGGRCTTIEVCNPLGDPCTSGDECSSGHCIAGICCDTACAGGCELCDATTSGVCTPLSGTACQPANQCATGVCESGVCTPTDDKPDDTACSGASPYLGAGICQDGTCVVPPGRIACHDDYLCEGDPCLTGVCDTQTRLCVVHGDGIACAHPDICVRGSTCQAGVCAGGTRTDCPPCTACNPNRDQPTLCLPDPTQDGSSCCGGAGACVGGVCTLPSGIVC